ncbi:unnamed protein product [Hapterophycus canaliculatus]
MGGDYAWGGVSARGKSRYVQREKAGSFPFDRPCCAMYFDLGTGACVVGNRVGLAGQGIVSERHVSGKLATKRASAGRFMVTFVLPTDKMYQHEWFRTASFLCSWGVCFPLLVAQLWSEKMRYCCLTSEDFDCGRIQEPLCLRFLPCRSCFRNILDHCRLHEILS